jgi:hypothetical protein
MGDLEQQLLNTNIVLMAAAAWFIMWVIRKVWKGMKRIEWVRKLMPIYPAILCQGFVWIPGAMPPGEDTPTIGTRILTGLWCGFLASIGYQLIRRILERQGVVLPEDPSKLVPSITPTPPPAPVEDDDVDGDEVSSDDRVTPKETPIPKSDEDEKEKDKGKDGDDED